MEKTCPSGRCREGTTLLGIVGTNGVLGYVAPAITLDADFVERAWKGRNPESRFRFAEPCIEHGCGNWTDDRCGVIQGVLESPQGEQITQAAMGPLPSCTIRSSCRWFAQVGPKACAVCPYVVHTPRMRE